MPPTGESSQTGMSSCYSVTTTPSGLQGQARLCWCVVNLPPCSAFALLFSKAGYILSNGLKSQGCPWRLASSGPVCPYPPGHRSNRSQSLRSVYMRIARVAFADGARRRGTGIWLLCPGASVAGPSSVLALLPCDECWLGGRVLRPRSRVPDPGDYGRFRHYSYSMVCQGRRRGSVSRLRPAVR